MTLELQDKLYTSTQVAEILGVSLRTLYRYMEDGKIQSMRTASGRHRFTKENILAFLNANASMQPINAQQPVAQPQYQTPVQPSVAPEVQPASPVVAPVEQPGVTANPEDSTVQAQAQTQPQAQTQTQTPATQVSAEDSNVKLVSPVVSQHDEVQTPPVSVDTEVVGQEEVGFPSVAQPVAEAEAEAETETETETDVELVAEFKAPPIAPSAPEKSQSDFSVPSQSQSTPSSVTPVATPLMPPVSQGSPLSPVAPVAPAVATASATAPKPAEPVVPEIDLGASSQIRYFKSDYTDLIELAKKVKEIANTKDLEYAFTQYAGLSLHFLIKPFTILHFYANPEDMQIWRDELRLSPVNRKEDANIGIFINTDIVFVPSKEIGGFRVVEDKILLNELSDSGDEELFKKFRQHLTQN